jgi:hypothetical protein
MRASITWAWLLGSVAGLLGCGGESSSPSSAPAPAETPLKGKDLSQTSQLVGTWSALTEGEFDCLEFMKDGKALVGDGSAGLTVDYSVLDGGRLSLMMPGGLTAVFGATIAGDQLELNGKASALSSGGTQRFRRLKAGETCADARKAQAKAKADAYQKRVAALSDFLKQPGLVLAFTETGPSTPASIALVVEAAGGGFSGKAWHDDKPPHLNLISGQLQLNEAANMAQVIISYGQRLAPPAAQPDGGGQIAMNVEGDGKDLRISAKVTFGGGGPAHEMVLRSDPKLHAEIVKRYEAELARIESLKQPIIKLLKDYAVLRGQLKPMDTRKTEPDTADLTLVRDPKSGQYYCEGVTIGMRDRGELATKAAAEIVIANDRPWLRILCPPAREYMLAFPDEKANKLAGQWMMPGTIKSQRCSPCRPTDGIAGSRSRSHCA